MCVGTESSDPAHPLFWHKSLPNEEQIENPARKNSFKKIVFVQDCLNANRSVEYKMPH